jgi:hypothetical protein
MSRRRTAFAGGILLSALALAACGSSSGSSTSTTSTAAPLTKAEATTLAGQINLTPADVPGSTASPNPPSADSKAADEALASCTGGVPPSQQIVNINSDSFTTGSGLNEAEASSNVTVLPSAALVQQNLKALTSAKGHQCLNTQLNKLLTTSSHPGVTFSSGTITTLPFSSAGNDGGFAVRVTVNAVAQGLHIPFFIDVVGFAQGPTEVELEALGISKPYPASEEARLLSLLETRAKAHAPTS